MKIVAIGDSITEGYPFSRQVSWVEYAARELELEILNQGICGDLTMGMCERFQRDVLDYNPTHVIILGGANDAFEGYPPAEVSSNFKEMVKKSRQHGIIPILGLPTPSLLPAEEVFLAEYRSWMRGYAGRENILCIDFYTPFQAAVQAGLAEKLFVDEVHPSIEGYKLMGEIVVQSADVFRK